MSSSIYVSPIYDDVLTQFIQLAFNQIWLKNSFFKNSQTNFLYFSTAFQKFKKKLLEIGLLLVSNQTLALTEKHSRLK